MTLQALNSRLSLFAATWNPLLFQNVTEVPFPSLHQLLCSHYLLVYGLKQTLFFLIFKRMLLCIRESISFLSH